MIKNLVLSGDQKKINNYLSIALKGVEQTVSFSLFYSGEPLEKRGENYLVDWKWQIFLHNGQEGILFLAPYKESADLVDEFFTYEELDDLYKGKPLGDSHVFSIKK